MICDDGHKTISTPLNLQCRTCAKKLKEEVYTLIDGCGIYGYEYNYTTNALIITSSRYQLFIISIEFILV